MLCSTVTRWNASMRVLKYLWGTLLFALHYASTCDVSLSGFMDSNWSGDMDDRSSQVDIASQWAQHAYLSSIRSKSEFLFPKVKQDTKPQMQPLQRLCGWGSLCIIYILHKIVRPALSFVTLWLALPLEKSCLSCPHETHWESLLLYSGLYTGWLH